MNNKTIKKLDKFLNPPKYFKFYEDVHKYYYKKEELISVTTFYSKFYEKFDTEYWSNRKAEELGITVEELLEDWKYKSDKGTTIGSIVHKWIEDFLNNLNPKIPTIDYDIGPYLKDEINVIIKRRINKWFQLYTNKLSKMTPVAQELRIWSLKYKLAGTIDTLFWYKNKLIVGDWKTNKKFTTDEDYNYNKYLVGPFSNEKDNEHNRFSIQVSLYRLMLEEHGIETGPSFICWIPPENGDVILIQAKDYRNILRAHLNNL
jgi:ATP-dependent exoDNAse (exonuclease V) beta subunit